MDIKALHQHCKEQSKDLYTFLEEKLPHLDTEGRLKVMAEILNDYLEEYEFNQKDKLKRDEYSITRFFPKR